MLETPLMAFRPGLMRSLQQQQLNRDMQLNCLKFFVFLVTVCTISVLATSTTTDIDEGSKCQYDRFLCEDGKKCIPLRWKCDYVPDCPDGSDEPDDCAPRTCSPGQFQCAIAQKCIPLGWVCDGEPDCSFGQNIQDTSDEDARRCGKGNPCPQNYFRCKDNITCKPISVLCDGRNDCPDWSDEAPFCHNKTMCEGMECEYKCRPSLLGPLCYCGEGKEPNGTKCVDTDECKMEGTCDQICVNTEGSHICSCVSGYEQRDSQCYAVNVPEYQPATVIFSNAKDIQHIYLNGSLVPGESIALHPDAFALDFDHRNQSVCWVNVVMNKSILRCGPIKNLSHTWDIIPSSTLHLGTATQLAFDWVSGNWYFLDDEREIIFVCNHTLSVCITLVDVGLSKPRGIALDPTKGLMFFTEWGSSAPLLERSRMDGSDRKTLVHYKIVYPYGLAVDYPNEHVYWVDTYLDYIERVDYTGVRRITIIKGTPVQNLYGITVFEQNLYVTSWREHRIVRVNKYNQSDHVTILENLSRPFAIHVFHRQRQPDVNHSCAVNNGNCEHICITLWKNTKPIAECLCKPGFILKSSRCMRAKKEQFLLFGKVRPGMIKGIAIGPGDKQQEVMEPIMDLTRPTALDYDVSSQYIYYSDIQRFVIERRKVDGGQPEKVIDQGLNGCEGLAIDWMGKNIYWTDEALNSIFVTRLSDTSVKKLLVYGNMTHPRSIVVHPKAGYMYWTDWSVGQNSGVEPTNRGKIERAWMDGTNREVLVSAKLRWPNGLTIDFVEKKLYFCDTYLHKIERMNLNGSEREVFLEGDDLEHPYSLAYYAGFVYWSEFQRGKIQRASLSTKKIETLRIENPPIFELLLFNNASQTGSNPCSLENKCEDLCLAIPMPPYFTCSCRDGFAIADNKSSCELAENYTDPTSCKENEFRCNKNHRCIDRRFLCDGDNDCGDESDEDSSDGGVCEKVTCGSDSIKCGKNKCISVHWACDGDRDCEDGTDESPAVCQANTCGPSQFTCKITHRCIPMGWTCDLDNDCGEGDNSDEHEDCNYPTCDNMEFQCDNKRCIPAEYVCDTDDDCRDDSDERDCPNTCSGAHQFQCASDHTCVPDYVRCNSVWDCYDGSDEVNCTSTMPPLSGACHENEFQCGDGSCIWKAWQCDLMPDCADASDEVGCVNVTCGPQEVMCDDRSRCIYRGFLCDGERDCHDGSDERDCSTNTSTCPFPSRLCDGGKKCINVTSLCNEKPDCDDGTDEGLLCADKMCTFTDCSDLCQNTPDGFLCYCRHGRHLQDNGRMCSEASPCSTWGICSQLCIESKNSYKCDCLPDYEIEPDHFTCKSRNSTSPMIIFSNRHELRAVDLVTLAVRALISGLKNTIALDFFYSKDVVMIFWTDVVDDKIYRGTLVGGSLNNIEVVVQTGLATAEGLAVDWIGENLYWVESNLDQIEVAKLNGSFRRTLIAGDMESPRAIALDPRYGVMFWTDWDSDAPRIESSSMSGDGRKVIFRVDNATDGAWPNGLTLDYVAHRIYWIDAKSDSIHTAQYDGSDHREVARGNEYLTHPFAIALFGNNVYWTDWRINSVVGANKWNGSNTVVLQRTMTQPFDIHVLHPSRQPRDIKNPCGDTNGGCSHLCLLSFKSTYSCHCPHVMKLSGDNRTCVRNEKVFLFSRHNEIRGVDLDLPYHHIIPPFSIPLVVSASQIDFDASERKIYWTDSQLNEVKRASLSGVAIETIIDTAIAHPSGFAIDWISRNMYIISQDSDRTSILACKLHGEYLTRIVDTDIVTPKSLAINPLTGKLYWSEHGTSLHLIKQANMDGSAVRVVVSQRDDEHLSAPSSLTMDFKDNRLYWVNTESRTIQYYDVAKKRVVNLPVNSHWSQPQAITVDGDNLYYADHANKSISIVDKTSGKNYRLMRNNTSDVLALRIYNVYAQTGSNPCAINNGGCAHLCLPKSAETRSCRCAIGFTANAKDVTKCAGLVSFLLYSNKLELRGISLDLGNANAEVLAPISRVSLASAIDFVAELDYIYWVDSEMGSITRIHRDGTGREVIVQGLETVEGIAIDWIAGNIYWTERSLDVIEVARLNGSCRYVVMAGDMYKPTAIAVHPVKGYLFFTHVGQGPKIERAGLDGGSRHVLVNSSVMSVSDLSVDYADSMLYWCDSRLDVIERIGFDGLRREVILQGSNMGPVAISLLDDYLFWIDTVLEHGSVLKADKNNATNYDVMRRSAGDSLQDVLVYHQDRQSGTNPCFQDNGKCEELCFFLGNGNYTCACAHGKVAADGTSCEDYDAFIMYSRVSRIDSIHMFDKNVMNAPFKSIQDPEYMRNVIGLTFDYEMQRIFYSDIQRGSIHSVFFNGTNHTVIVDKQGSVEGLTYEKMHQELYWTCNSDASINRISLNVKNAQVTKIVQLGPDDKPRGIAVDSCDSRMYWTNWNSRHSSIQRSYLSGYELESIITTDIRMPNALAIDHKAQKLYWTDARFDKVERCNLDGTYRHVILTAQPHHPFDIAVYGNYIFWTDWVLHAVLRANKYTGEDVVILRNNVPRPMGIIAIARDSEDCTINPCHTLNGGCQDVCNVDENSTVTCECYAGRVLLADGMRCAVKFANCTDWEFECTGGVCIPYHLTCDGEPECPDESDEALSYCAYRSCRDGYFHCNNNRCVPSDRVCNENDDCGDGSDELVCNCTESQFRCASGMCISQVFRCDFDADCGDASDEMGCPFRECTPSVVDGTSLLHPLTLVNCTHTTACIHPDWICDGQNDCWDNSDEENCNATSAPTDKMWCPDASHRCRTGRCIPQTWVCDRDEDCADGGNVTASSDEENCNYTCPADKFQCGTTLACIPKTWQCDGLPDCADRSDETEDCQTRQCSENEFRCNKTGQCIPMYWVCDGENDCADDEASDEHPDQGCLIQLCPEDSFQCNNYRCIYKGFYCDRDDDCGDKSDEPVTCDYQPCASDQFQCKNKVACIPLSWLCNHINECGDYSDEDASLCHVNDTSRCGDSRYECANGGCIDENLVCNGENNCGDYSDEERCNINECESGKACSQHCEDKPIGFVCSCHDGFRLRADKKTCEDIDECKELHPCSQFCYNRHGHYSCSCADGYVASDGGRSCKLNGTSAPSLIFSNRYYIRQVDFSGQETMLLAHNLTNAVALDYDWLEKCIYWSDVTALGSSLKRMCNGQAGHRVLHSATVQNPDGLAVDWIGRNLYWCDKGTDTIEVSRLDGQFRKVLVREGLQEPRAIVLDPMHGYLYWTDWGERPYIAKIGMDGSQQKVIVNDSLGWPNALTINYVTKELFWADAREDYIAVTDLDGNDRHIIIGRGVSHPLHHIFSLAVFEDYLFWTDWETKSVERCLKYSCTEPHRIVTTIHRPMSVHIYHPDRQPQLPDGENPCLNNGGCQTLCLLQPGGRKSTCGCPENYYLAEDGVACISNCTLTQFVCATTYKCIPFWWRCDTQDDCGDGSDEPANCQHFYCTPGQFQCHNGTCIHPSQICDGVSQCRDGSDEVNCEEYPCLSTQFKCSSNESMSARCIPASGRCDGQVDCPNKEDEGDCPPRTCPTNQFTCGNGKCIPNVWVCDNDNDCGDASDEPGNCKERLCPKNQLRCNSGRCIPMSWRCDGDHDCVDGEDEPSSCSDQDFHSCESSYFQCKNHRCIPGRWQCDYDNDCGDNSDEIGCKPRNCSESEFRCKNGRCIRGSWHCNGEFNCDDHSDEQDCPSTCQPNEFQCRSPKFCIYDEWRCDGDTDCADGSDEEGCGLTCKEGEHTCTSGECISKLWVCDSDDDCDDRSDEDPAVCSKLACRPDQFRCGGDGVCISRSKVCDGVNNCNDHSDEDGRQCPHLGGRVCNESQFRCDGGHCILHQLVCDKSDDCGDYSDERDCEEHPCKFGTCSQLCIRKKSGNITCACAPGYAWRHSRSCEAHGHPAYLMIASDGELRRLNPYKPSATQDDILQNSPTDMNKIDSIDVYFNGGKPLVFWTDYKSKYIVKHRAPSTSLPSSPSNRSRRVKRNDAAEIVVSGLNEPRGIAVDWVSERLYWVDAGDDTISSIGLNGSQRVTLVRSQLDQPHDIVVDPESGKMFWTDWGMHAKVEVASLDGSDRKVLVDAGVHWPSGIALDYMGRRVYWADPKAGTIESVTVEGKDRHVVKSFGLDEDKPFRLDVFEDDLYVTTFHSHNILKMNKFGRGNITSLVQGLHRATDIVIVQEYKQSANVSSACSAAADVCGDGSVCVQRGATRHSCVCLDGLVPVEGGGKYSCVGHQLPKPSGVCNLICLNGGTCVIGFDGSQFCSCKDSYDGERCERYRCSEHCKNRGFCYSDLLMPEVPGQKPPLKCSCPPEWTGDRCEIPADICRKFCKNGGTCHISKGGAGARCTCPPDLTGAHCESCVDFECGSNGGTCKRNSMGHPICDCAPGHFGDHCERSECDNYCVRGKCAVRADGVPECSCPSGYSGKTCDNDLCRDHCQNGGTCLRNAKKLACECPIGYSGPRCETNRCQCKNNGVCISAKNEELVCNCLPGFSGRLCEKYSGVLCNVNNCQNGGTCIMPAEGQTKCHCPPGWLGPLCEEPANPCQGYCANGNCSLSKGLSQEPVCKCHRGFIGVRCDTADVCHDFCLNGGTCIPPASFSALKPVCFCPHGLEGLRCETVVGRPRGSSSGTSSGVIGTFIAVVIAVMFLVASALAVTLLCRKRRRGNPFMHKRMQDSSNVEISNPMYMRGDCEDEAAEPMEPSFTIDTDKVTNFTNPVYDSLYSDSATGVSSEEKKGLLQGENLKVEYYDGHNLRDPLRDTDRESFA